MPSKLKCLQGIHKFKMKETHYIFNALGLENQRLILENQKAIMMGLHSGLKGNASTDLFLEVQIEKVAEELSKAVRNTMKKQTSQEIVDEVEEELQEKREKTFGDYLKEMKK